MKKRPTRGLNAAELARFLDEHKDPQHAAWDQNELANRIRMTASAVGIGPELTREACAALQVDVEALNERIEELTGGDDQVGDEDELEGLFEQVCNVVDKTTEEERNQDLGQESTTPGGWPGGYDE